MDDIKNKVGIFLDLIDEECDNNICKVSITKSYSDLKKVLFKVPEDPKKFKYIEFKYKKTTFFSTPDHPFFSCLLGLLLAIPNIIWFITRRIKRKMAATYCTFFMNLLLNIAYGALIGGIIGLGNEASYMIAMSFGGTYLAFCLFSLLFQCCGIRGYFDVIFNLCKKLDDSSSLEETIRFNRKTPPSVFAGCYADHKESREVWREYEKYKKPVYRTERVNHGDGSYEEKQVFSHYEDDYRYLTTHYSSWERVDRGGGKIYGTPGHYNSRYEKSVEYRRVETWRREIEYRYKSWQDVTQDIKNVPYYTIVEATFTYRINLDAISTNFMSTTKNELFREGKNYDTDVHTYERLEVPQPIKKIKCSLNDEEYQRIKNKFSNCCGFFCWTILFILGYSSIFEAYSRYEIGEISINIVKYVSGQMDKRAGYRCIDENVPPISFTFSYTKLQKKQIEKNVRNNNIQNNIDVPLTTIY